MERISGERDLAKMRVRSLSILSPISRAARSTSADPAVKARGILIFVVGGIVAGTAMGCSAASRVPRKR